MRKGLPSIQTCKFVPVTDLDTFFAPGYLNQFFERLADDQSITWGDSNRTMISAERFRDAIESATFPKPGQGIKFYTELLTYLDELESQDVYIDMEN